MIVNVLLSILFGLGWVPLFVYRAESLEEALPSYRGGERFWVLMAPVILATHVTVSCLLLSFVPPITTARAIVSVLVFAAGITFWMWARVLIGPVRVTRLPDQPPERLRRDGPFGVVRNPLYLGVLIAAAAPALAAGEPLLAISYALSLIALAIRAAQEERRLHAQLGAEYADYCREVPRLIPFVW